MSPSIRLRCYQKWRLEGCSERAPRGRDQPFPDPFRFTQNVRFVFYKGFWQSGECRLVQDLANLTVSTGNDPPAWVTCVLKTGAASG